MSSAELQLLLTAKDMASGALRAFAGVMTSTVVGALSDVARAAAEDEANVVKLRTAVENSGVAWEDNVRQINERIKHGQDLAFTDTQVRDSLAALTQTTGDLNAAMNLQQLAFDLSRAKGMDLTTASELIGKVSEGNVSVLKRYGVVLGEGATATEALAALQQKFGGQAEAYGTTTSASIFKVKDSIDEWRESIGQSLGPAQLIIGLLPGISAGFTGITAALALLTPVQNAWIASTAAAVAPVLLVIATVVLVVEALIQLWETVDFVREHWEVFVLALTSGRLNDIPFFGFFFSKAQALLGFIQMILNAWNGLTSLISGFQMPSISLPSFSLPSFASGGIVPGPIGAPQLVIAHGGEEVRTAGAGGGAGGVTVVFTGDVYGMQDFEDKVASIFRDRRLAGGFRGVG